MYHAYGARNQARQRNSAVGPFIDRCHGKAAHGAPHSLIARPTQCGCSCALMTGRRTWRASSRCPHTWLILHLTPLRPIEVRQLKSIDLLSTLPCRTSGLPSPLPLKYNMLNAEYCSRASGFKAYAPTAGR
jgi:hypothetical protein